MSACVEMLIVEIVSVDASGFRFDRGFLSMWCDENMCQATT